MAYDKYSSEKVFQDDLVNVYCNKILDSVQSNFQNSEAKLVATFDLSRMIQGQAVASLPVVPFVTNDTAIYDYLVKNLQSLVTVQTQISFKNRIQLVTSYAFFEFWLDEAMVGTVNINGLYCRDFSESYPAPVSPYNIPLTDQQAFTASAQNELYVQGWAINVQPPIKFIHVLGSVDPAAVNIDIQVEDVFKTQPAGKYSAFKFYTAVMNWQSPFSQWHLGHILLGGDAALLYPGTDLLQNELAKTVSVECRDLNVLEPGQRTWDLYIDVNGVRADSGFVDVGIARLVIPCQLEVLDSNALFVDPLQVTLAHVKNAAPLDGVDFQIYTSKAFTLSIPDYFEVSGGNLVEKASSYQRRNYDGSGPQVLTLKATASFDAYQGTEYNGILSIVVAGDNPLSTRGRQIEEVSITAFLFEVDGFSVSPQSLEFIAIKGIEAPEKQDLEVICSEDFTLTHPYWLKVSPTAGSIFQKISVQPISADNLVPGDYFDVIEFTSANATFEVPVSLKVVETIDKGFLEDSFNFTHDNKVFTQLYSNKSNERASVDLGITRYDFNGFSSFSEALCKLSFFKSRTSVHLGDIIRRRFSSLEKPSEIGYQNYNLEEDTYQLFKVFPYYRPAEVNVSLNIEDRATGSVSAFREFQKVLFVSGRRPKNYDQDYGILNFACPPIRVTQKSQMLFNFVRRFLDHEIKVYRNNALYKTITHSPGNNSLFGLAMFFKDFIPGDVIDIRLEKNENENFIQQYVVFPEQPNSSHIVFENEYRVLESFEFTGAFEFTTDTKVVASKTYKDLVEKIENLEINKEQRLKINTGWILKSNQLIIDAISRSKKAWLLIEGKEISLRPVEMKFSNEDSERQLYAYDVEFIINRDNDLEVYTS